MGHNVLKWVFKLKYALAFAIFAVCIGLLGESSLVNRMKQQQEIGKLRSEIDVYTRKFEQDKNTLYKIEHDHDAIIQVARERYYMKTEEEDIFIIEDEEDLL